MKIIKDIDYSKYKECFLDIYLPDSEPFSIFIYFYRGGLQSGDKEEARIMVEYLLDKNVAVVSANYRMYPEVEYPNYIFDAAM